MRTFGASLVCSLVVLILGCSDQALSPSSETGSSVQTIEYRYQGASYTVSYREEGDNIIPVDTSNVAYLTSIIESESGGAIIDLRQSNVVWLYTNRTELEQIKAEALGAEHGLAKKATVNQCYIYRDLSYTGDRVRVTSSIPDLRTVGMNDDITSLKIDGFAVFYEHPNFGGKGTGFIGRVEGYEMPYGTPIITGYPDLRKICRTKFLWWCSSTWNDVISSIET